MSRKKKSKDEFVNFIRHIFNRNRADRTYSLPKDYLMSVADKIWRTTPSRDIIYNTLVDVASVIFERGYARKSDDLKFFKEKQDKDFNREFNELKDNIDDMIHQKSNQPK